MSRLMHAVLLVYVSFFAFNSNKCSIPEFLHNMFVVHFVHERRLLVIFSSAVCPFTSDGLQEIDSKMHKMSTP